MFIKDKKKSQFQRVTLNRFKKCIILPTKYEVSVILRFFKSFLFVIRKTSIIWFSQNLKFIGSTLIDSLSECILYLVLLESTSKTLSNTSTLQFNNIDDLLEAL